jgi:hypothetical protein
MAASLLHDFASRSSISLYALILQSGAPCAVGHSKRRVPQIEGYNLMVSSSNGEFF